VRVDAGTGRILTADPTASASYASAPPPAVPTTPGLDYRRVSGTTLRRASPSNAARPVAIPASLWLSRRAAPRCQRSGPPFYECRARAPETRQVRQHVSIHRAAQTRIARHAGR
jgi:hypothetical protein